MRARAARQRGFSLLEVVVALAILGLVLATLADSVRGGLLGGAKAAAVELLLAEAEARIASVGTVEPLEPGTRRGDDGFYHWRLDVEEFRDPALDLEETDLPRAFRVKVTVTSEQGGVPRSLALETVRLRFRESPWSDRP
jgi:general secretion pathway protein I